MRYVSLDLETTGLRPDRDQILQVAMVLEDTAHPEVAVEDLPFFTCLVSHPEYSGQAYALALNHEILMALAGAPSGEAVLNLRERDVDVYPWDGWVPRALTWLASQVGLNVKVTVAGKNAAGFDLPFIRETEALCPEAGSLTRRFYHRVLDPGSVFWHPRDETSTLPSLAELKYNLGLGGVVHDALDDARDVIRVLRRAGARL